VRILVVQLKRIGDLVLTTPVLDCLRKKFPAATISLAVEAGSAGLLPCLEYDEAFVFRRGSAALAPWWNLLRLPFDLVIDLTGNDRSAAVSALARARQSVTYAKWRTRPFRRFIYTDFVESPVADLHAADHHTALLRAVGIEATNIPSRLIISPEDDAAAASLLAENKIHGGFVVVHPGTVKEEKFWLPERWAAVMAFLRQRGFSVVLTGSAAAPEKRHAASILASLTGPPDPGIISLIGCLSLPQLAAIIQRAALVCGVDSAPLHFADALGRPVLGLFGPTCPHQWRPRRPGSVVVTPKGTSIVGPEYYPGLPMEKISTDLVLPALGEIGLLRL
jgi:predicted lipopolysaccharide heptosyltransferase III